MWEVGGQSPGPPPQILPTPYLGGVGRGWQRELFAIELKDHRGLAAQVLAVEDILKKASKKGEG